MYGGGRARLLGSPGLPNMARWLEQVIGGFLGGTPGSQIDRQPPRWSNRGNNPLMASPGVWGLSHRIKYLWEDDRPWEMISLPPLPFRTPSNQSYFIYMFCLAYIMSILCYKSKSVTTQKCENKSEKNTRPCRTPDVGDPAKREHERTKIERATPNFRAAAMRAFGSSPRAVPFLGCAAPWPPTPGDEKQGVAGPLFPF